MRASKRGVDLNATYILPIRAEQPAIDEAFASYLNALGTRMQVLVMDGSAKKVFAEHDRLLLHVEHVEPDRTGLNGKVAAVLSGVERAGHDAIVIADDDVRYDEATLERALALLGSADLVIPQNYFRPTPWHALWDTARSLLNRVVGGDWPGTLIVRRSAIEAAGGYDADVLFENLELVRTLRASGARVMRRDDLYVRRLPPRSSGFWSQRVRQAYDEFARPSRFVAQLAIAPLLVLSLLAMPAMIPAATAGSIAVAEIGRRRHDGHRYFPLIASFLAPLWLLERAAGSWLALALRVFRGGVTYRGRVIRRAASSERDLELRLAARAKVSRRCAVYRDGQLLQVRSGRPAQPLERLVHDTLRGQVLSPAFPCLGARSALHRGTYRFALYRELGDEASSDELAQDLAAFVDDPTTASAQPSSFIASFGGPDLLDETAFEERLWRTLQLLHHRDRIPWDPSVSSDPAAPGFAFSFGGGALFVVGMHAASSRWARRTPWPTLVFNPHAQFRRLRVAGTFARMRDIVRARDRALQGSTNPMLADFGDTSEARQYAGRAVDPDWRCPFHAA